MGHSVRACIIGMRIAGEIGLPVQDQGDLYYSLLLKDAGCSSNASRLFHILSADEIRAKGDVKTTDWTRVGWESLQYAISHVATGAPFLERVRTLLRVAATQQRDSCELVKIRCERGSSVARRMGFSENVALAIFSLDEHWNGGGYPDGLRGKQVPLFSRIMNLSQTLEVFWVNRGTEAAVDVARQRSGRWFDPDLVKAAEDDATVALRVQRRLRAKDPNNFGMFTSDSLLALYHTATSGILPSTTGISASRSPLESARSR